MYTVHGMPSRAHAAADATPCWPAPVSAITRFAPSFLDGVVDLVRAGVGEVFALQPHLCAPPLRQRSRMRERRRPPDPAAQLGVKFIEESAVAQVTIDARLQAVERRHQRLRHIAPAERPEAAARVGIFALQHARERRLGIDRNRASHRLAPLAAARARCTNS
jgi:hypothetical protein